MQYTLIMLIGDIRQTCILFALCGLFVYLYDYRPLKQKNEFSGERTFSRFVVYIYGFGSIVTYVATMIADFII